MYYTAPVKVKDGGEGDGGVYLRSGLAFAFGPCFVLVLVLS
jgi:hypothetical protein